MLVLGELPLAFVESVTWRHFCSTDKPYKPHSCRTATKNIVKMYVKRKEPLKRMFKSTKERVSVTTDIWVAPTTGDHKRSTISAVLLECLTEWGIKKIFTAAVDNATANTSALKKFKDAFKSVGNDTLVLGGEFMHMQCAVHILNLIVREGLQAVDANVAVILNGVQYVRSSTLRCKSFELQVDSGKMSGGSLPMDLKTRWNLTYLKLSRTMKFRLAFIRWRLRRNSIMTTFWSMRMGNMIGPPTLEDWDAVERLVRFLIIFFNSTLVVSACNKVNSHKWYNEIVIKLNLASVWH